MGTYRNISASFWDDNKVTDDFTAEDRYFFLYLLTNPHTNICGCYEVSMTKISQETGFTKDKSEKLIERMETVLNVVRYSRDTKEVLILNWGKYNWTKSDKLVKAVERVSAHIKNHDFKAFVLDSLYGNDTLSIPYQYPMDTSVSVSVSDTVSVTDKEPEKEVVEIIDYFNKTCGTKYRYKSKEIVEAIHGRMKDGFTVDDFKTVINKKHAEWHGTEWEKYLRPSTLFRPSHFEEYLNAKAREPTAKSAEAEAARRFISDG